VQEKLINEAWWPQWRPLFGKQPVAVFHGE
jgi:hypothetical protein